MNTITTTNLRTQSSQLVNLLKQGKKVSLVHRSQIVGEISPVKTAIKSFDLKKFREFIKAPKSDKDLTYEEREEHYRTNLEKKHGKNLS